MKKHFIYLLIMAVAFTGCISVKQVEVKEIEGIELVDRQGNMATVKVNLKVNNPNRFKIKVRSCNLNAELNGRPMGVVTTRDKIVMPKRSCQSYSMNFTADITEMLKTLPMLMFSRSASLSLKGVVIAQVWFIRRKVPIEVTERFSTDDIQF
ncbi:MAG: LEA type 2 family protein [Cytophagaceae bacterium]